MFTTYEIKQKIAVGGMAEVFLSRAKRDDGIEQTLVLKRLLPEFSRDMQFVASLFNEAHLAASLKHPHIVQIFDFGRINDSFFLSLEYVDGYDCSTILSYLKRTKTFIPLEVAASIFVDTCMGLDFAHQANDAEGKWLGLVHRDVSPANIIISREGSAKLLDFGIAKATESDNSNQTQAGMVKGKFAYLSPEQVLGKQVDKASDVYAVALTFYELLTRVNPFKGDTSYHSLQKVMNETVVPAHELHPECTPEMGRIIAKGMARSVDERYTSCGEMARELQAVLRANKVNPSHSTVRKYLRDNQDEFNKVDERAQLQLTKSDMSGKTLFLTRTASMNRLTGNLRVKPEDIRDICDAFDETETDPSSSRSPTDPGSGSGPKRASPTSGGRTAPTNNGRVPTNNGRIPTRVPSSPGRSPTRVPSSPGSSPGARPLSSNDSGGLESAVLGDEIAEVEPEPRISKKVMMGAGAVVVIALIAGLALFFGRSTPGPVTATPVVAAQETGVTIVSTPPGAQVLLSLGDGARLVLLSGVTPMTVAPLDSDWNYSYEVRMPKYQALRGSFNLKANENRQVKVTLRSAE